MTQLAREDFYERSLAIPVDSAEYADCVGSVEPEKIRFASFLRAELEQQNRSIADLSRATGLRYGVISRWLDPVVERRMVPSSANCHLIADALGIDEAVVLVAAGHVRERAMTAPRPPFWEDMQAIFRREKRYLSMVNARDWPYFKALLEAHVESMRIAVERFDEAIEAIREDRGPVSRDGA